MSALFSPDLGVGRKSMWLTTAQAAERLHYSTGHVRRLARQGVIAYLLTGNGQHLFRREDIWRYAEERSEREARRRPTQLAALRPRMAYRALEPRQMSMLSLLLGTRLRMARAGERSRPHADVKGPEVPVKSRGSEKPRYVTRKIAGGRR